jgi:uncharacterized membrane protein
MDYQNLWYALTQIAHNFGAVAVVALPVHAFFQPQTSPRRGLLLLTLAGWLVQLASGLTFGLTSLHYYGQLPDIHGPAIAALSIKLVCAVTAVGTIFLVRQRNTQRPTGKLLWLGLALLGITALTAAAVLRWFS